MTDASRGVEMLGADGYLIQPRRVSDVDLAPTSTSDLDVSHRSAAARRHATALVVEDSHCDYLLLCSERSVSPLQSP
jgi:hypothetical protein